MTVYVDDGKHSLRTRGGSRLVMCHMIADTWQELLDMAERLELNPKWVQYPGTHKEHFDISQSKRRLALSFGAKAIPERELAEMVRRRGMGISLQDPKCSYCKAPLVRTEDNYWECPGCKAGYEIGADGLETVRLPAK